MAPLHLATRKWQRSSLAMDSMNDMYWFGLHFSVLGREETSDVTVISSSAHLERNKSGAKSSFSSIDGINVSPWLSRFVRLACRRKSGSVNISGCRMRPVIYRPCVLIFSNTQGGRVLGMKYVGSIQILFQLQWSVQKGHVSAIPTLAEWLNDENKRLCRGFQSGPDVSNWLGAA